MSRSSPVVQELGTWPVTCSHRVDQGRPQRSPTEMGVYVWLRASSKGTGSSGTSQASMVRGAVSRWRRAGSISRRNRRTRSSLVGRLSCME